GAKRCHIVGISMGGPIALLFNERYPDVAQSLVIADSFAKPAEESPEHVAATKEAIAYITMQEFGTQYTAQRLLPSSSLDVQDELAAAGAKVSAKIYNETMASALLGDVTGTLVKVKVPTLVLVGEQDDVTPRPASEVIASGIKVATLELIPNAGHL